MALVFIRTAIIFVTLLFVMRLMGKSQIGEMQPFEFVITLLIAELACIPMADSSIPLLYGIVSIVCIFILHQIVWLLDLWWQPFKGAVCGKPSIVINPHGIDEGQLKRNNLDVSDLIESMRVAGYFALDDVYYGVYEANGSFSAIPKEQTSKELSITLIDGGKVDKKNLQLCQLSQERLEDMLKERKLKTKHVLVMTIDGKGRVYFQASGKPYEVLQLEGTKAW